MKYSFSDLYPLVSEMSESDLLSSEQIDGIDGLENGQDGDALMHNDGVRRDFTEANIDDPVSQNTYTQMRLH